EGFGSLDEFIAIITAPPTWAPDFPIAAKGRITDRLIEIKEPNATTPVNNDVQSAPDDDEEPTPVEIVEPLPWEGPEPLAAEGAANPDPPLPLPPPPPEEPPPPPRKEEPNWKRPRQLRRLRRHPVQRPPGGFLHPRRANKRHGDDDLRLQGC